MADEVRENGSLVYRDRPLVLKFQKKTAPAATPGTVWEVAGNTSLYRSTVNGFSFLETRMIVSKATMIRPSGELLSRWIAANIDGIGDVKARRIVRALPDLNKVIRDKNAQRLMTVSGVSEELAQRLIANWPADHLYETIAWLQNSELPLRIADQLVRVYENDAVNKLKSNPFLLTAFGLAFSDILKLINRFEIEVSEFEVLAAIAEHITLKYTQRTQSTVIPQETLVKEAQKLCRDLEVCHADLCQAAKSRGVLLRVEGGLQAIGTAIQENTVGHFFKRMASRQPGAGCLLAAWERDVNTSIIEQALRDFEGVLSFKLTREQRSAIAGAVCSPVAVISGGAGTGKTTILKAILSVYEKVADGLAVFQIALSGRAAQRMAGSTGRPAVTIAKFLYDHLGERKEPLPEHILLIVDEASMVDLLSAYKLVGILPEATRIILVGDAAQLPPVGAGLVFHAAMKSDLPVFNLSEVKRQRAESGIHSLATAIRNKTYTRQLLAPLQGDVYYFPTMDAALVVEEYTKTRSLEECIVISPTRKGPLGVDVINRLIQSHFEQTNPKALHYNDDQFGYIPWITNAGTSLRLGDRIMVTKNDYKLNIRNGDLGSIVQVFGEPLNDSFGEIEVNGEIIPVTREMLEKLDLGYATTIHKSQGSQWKKCILILPGHAEKMIDQSLLYTAVTRASETLSIIGDCALIEKAIGRGAYALNRLTNLGCVLR